MQLLLILTLGKLLKFLTAAILNYDVRNAKLYFFLAKTHRDTYFFFKYDLFIFDLLIICIRVFYI